MGEPGWESGSPFCTNSGEVSDLLSVFPHGRPGWEVRRGGLCGPSRAPFVSGLCRNSIV